MVMTLSSAYLPPVSWFSELVRQDSASIEQWEHFHKQTIRNRCTIDSPNGPLNLTVPVDKSNFTDDGKCLMRDVMISYHNDWQHQHWNALKTSYFNSPFFEYLQDDFRPFYEKRWKFLMDFNEALVDKCCELIEITPSVSRTEQWMGKFHTDAASEDVHLLKPYYQVFAQKHGFLKDLSIVDLIFNMGKESVFYL